MIDGPKCVQVDRHEIGAFEVSFGGPDFGSGGGSMSYVTSSVGGAGGSCSATMSQLCLTDDDCPSGETCVVTGASYRLHYTINRRNEEPHERRACPPETALAPHPEKA